MGGSMIQRGAISLGLAGAALVLSGCSVLGADAAGGAASRSAVGGVSTEALVTQVQDFQNETGQPANAPAPGLARATLSRLVQEHLISVAAARAGVTVTPAQVDAEIAKLAAQNGGAEGLKQAATSSGIPSTAIPGVVRSNLLVAGLGQALAPGADQLGQLQATQTAITALSQDADVRVAPRYGIWDHQGLGITEASSVTTTLPSASAEPLPQEPEPDPAVDPAQPEASVSPTPSQ